jgi:hypothetical protein
MASKQSKTLSLGPALSPEQQARQRQQDMARKARQIAGQQLVIAQKAQAHAERASFLASLMTAAFEAGLNVDGIDSDAVELRIFRGDAWAARGDAWVVVRFPTLADCAGMRSVAPRADSVTALVREQFGARKGAGARCRVNVEGGKGDVARIVAMALANL